MASGKRPPPGNQRRRRPPTVINLEATEVESGPVTAEPQSDAPVEQPKSQPQADASAEQPQSDSMPRPEDAFIPPPPERPFQTASEQRASEPPREPSSGANSGRSFAWLPEELSWSQASAGIAGAAGALMVLLLLWLPGVLSGGRDQSADLNLNPRLAAIERQLQDLAARPTPAGVDPRAIEDLGARLGRLESAQAAPRAPVTDPVVLSRLTAAEQAAKSLADNVAALARRSDGVEAALRETQGRLERMSVAINELRTAARAAAAGSDRAARLALPWRRSAPLSNAATRSSPSLPRSSR